MVAPDRDVEADIGHMTNRSPPVRDRNCHRRRRPAMLQDYERVAWWREPSRNIHSRPPVDAPELFISPRVVSGRGWRLRGVTPENPGDAKADQGDPDITIGYSGHDATEVFKLACRYAGLDGLHGGGLSIAKT